MNICIFLWREFDRIWCDNEGKDNAMNTNVKVWIFMGRRRPRQRHEY